MLKPAPQPQTGCPNTCTAGAYLTIDCQCTKPAPKEHNASRLETEFLLCALTVGVVSVIPMGMPAVTSMESTTASRIHTRRSASSRMVSTHLFLALGMLVQALRSQPTQSPTVAAVNLTV
jgi:hypothetical protein